MQKAVDERSFSKVSYFQGTCLDPLRRDPRFTRLVAASSALVGVGTPARDFEVTLLDGSTFALSAQKGKVVVIDFWYALCAPCREELPNLRAIDAEFKDQGLVIVGVSLDTDRKLLDDYVKQAAIPWNLACSLGGWDDPTVKRTDQRHALDVGDRPPRRRAGLRPAGRGSATRGGGTRQGVVGDTWRTQVRPTGRCHLSTEARHFGRSDGELRGLLCRADAGTAGTDVPAGRAATRQNGHVDHAASTHVLFRPLFRHLMGIVDLVRAPRCPRRGHHRSGPDARAVRTRAGRHGGVWRARTRPEHGAPGRRILAFFLTWLVATPVFVFSPELRREGITLSVGLVAVSAAVALIPAFIVSSAFSRTPGMRCASSRW